MERKIIFICDSIEIIQNKEKELKKNLEKKKTIKSKKKDPILEENFNNSDEIFEPKKLSIIPSEKIEEKTLNFNLNLNENENENEIVENNKVNLKKGEGKVVNCNNKEILKMMIELNGVF